MSREEVAMGFLRVANEAMCRPIRALTQVQVMKSVQNIQTINESWDRRRATIRRVMFSPVSEEQAGSTPAQSLARWA